MKNTASEQASSPISPQAKPSKLAVLLKDKKKVFLILLFGLPFLCCCSLVIIGSQLPPTKSTTSLTPTPEQTAQVTVSNPTVTTTIIETMTPAPTVITSPTSTPLPTATPTPSYLLDANDYKKKDYSTIEAKYGKPENVIKETAPVYTTFDYIKPNYTLEAQYLNNDTLVYGASVEIKNHSCKFSDGLNLDQRLTALKIVNLESFQNKSWTYRTFPTGKRFELIETAGWARIYVTCSDDNRFLISFTADGWDLR